MSDEQDATRALFQPTVGATLGRYKILSKLGAGGMGVVYLAEETTLARTVALKFLPTSLAVDPEFRARFEREARAVASLHHPNIVHIYAVDEHRDHPFIAMEYVDGPALRTVLADGRLALPKATDYAEALAGALGEAHRSGVVHRDVKPGNVVVDSAGRPKLLDFGLAVLGCGDAITKTGTTLGTVGYMAPEQARGETADPRSDLFSLGVVLYEMVTGVQPFRAETEAATLDRVLHRTQDPLARYASGIPEGLERIVAKLLQKDPALRYQTAADLVADLQHERRLREGSIVTTSAPARPTRSSTPRWLAPAAIVALVALATLLWKPWERGSGLVTPADASQSRIVILDFKNLDASGADDNLGAIVSSLLVTDLSESRFLQVVSRQRVLEAAKSLGHDSGHAIDDAAAESVTRRVGGRWMLTGTILQSKPALVLTSQISEVRTGDVVASQRVTGTPGQDVFAVVDALTRELKRDLSLPVEAEDEPDPHLADITTRSPDAYRHFVLGVDYFGRFFKEEAKRELTRAVEIDSTFASAYFFLALVARSQHDDARTRMHLDAALRHADQGTWRERLEIEALDLESRGDREGAVAKLREITERRPDDPNAWFSLAMVLGRQDPGGIQALEQAVSMDSTFAQAYNQLAYAYQELGRIEDALGAINKYIALEPKDPNPYDSRGDLYAAEGKLAEARSSYLRANQIKPDFMPLSRYKLAMVSLLLDDEEEATRIFRELASDPSPEASWYGKRGLIDVEMYRGRIANVLELSGELIAEMHAAESYRRETLTRIRVILVRSYFGRHDEALREVETLLALIREHDTKESDWAFEVGTWASLRAGRADLAEEYTRQLGGLGEPARVNHLGALALLAEARGDLDEAARAYWESMQVWRDFYGMYEYGRLSRLRGRLDDAVTWLTRARDDVDQDRLTVLPFSVLVYYQLGLAYEASGWTDKAIDSYRRFLEIWHEADPRPIEMDDARTRLTALENGLG